MGAIGRASVRFRWFVVAAWVIATVAVVAALPTLASVVNPDNSAFLPSDQPSVRAAALAAPFAPVSGSTAEIVFFTRDGPITAADTTAFVAMQQRVRAVPNVTGVRDQGTSRDGKAATALVLTSVPTSGSAADRAVDGIRDAIAATPVPSGARAALTGELASNVDTDRHNQDAANLTAILTNVVVLVMLIIVFRSVLAPIVTLLPAVLVLLLGGGLVGALGDAGAIDVSTVTQSLFTVLVIGAGTDYGLFLVLRVREELADGHDPHEAVRRAVQHVGESIASSGGMVIVALLSLVFATFGLYSGMGPALAVAIAVMLLVSLTFTPAILAILGPRVFWPRHIRTGTPENGIWGRVADRVLARPVVALLVGGAFFLALSLCATGFSSAGFGGTTSGPSGSQSAEGTAALSAHFPPTLVDPTTVVMRFPTSVWTDLDAVAKAQAGLSAQPAFASVSGLTEPLGTPVPTSRLQSLYRTLGPPGALPPEQRTTAVPASTYNAYRSTAQFVSADGRTVQFETTLTAGEPSSTAALDAVPAIRADVVRVAGSVGAEDAGVVGLAPVAADVSDVSDTDLERIVPIVLVLIALLLGLTLRSIVAPLYLVASVALSYFASLGLAVIIFMWIGGADGLNFVLPFLLFIFLMALGEDYNVLVMSRIREEAHDRPLRRAIRQAMHVTGTTVTSAGLVLAATFLVVGVSGATSQVRQLGIAICLGVLMDTFLVRTLMVPSVVALLGRWNWWPSRLAQRPDARPAAAEAD